MNYSKSFIIPQKVREKLFTKKFVKKLVGERMIDFMAKVGRRFENIYDQKRKNKANIGKRKSFM